MAYLIGIDVGTSSTKAILINDSGQVIKTVAPEYDFHTPKPLWAESNPLDWWTATIAAIKSLLDDIDASKIVGLGLTGQMHGLVCLDKDGEVLRPCIMWNDQRTADQCREMTARIGDDDVIAITGNPILPGFTAPKLRWIEENEPEVYSRIDKILLPKDYIRYKLSGEFFTDVSDASGTSLLDVQQRRWAHYILNEFKWPMSWLPEVTESTEATTRISSDAATVTGLPSGLPIIA
ncbi:MAG: xylulokinase, partial [Opitutae bacterium]|nr:xylulokinase [Opitutae bacterium]